MAQSREEDLLLRSDSFFSYSLADTFFIYCNKVKIIYNYTKIPVEQNICVSADQVTFSLSSYVRDENEHVCITCVFLSEVCSFTSTLISFWFEAFILKFSAASVIGGTSECPPLIG